MALDHHRIDRGGSVVSIRLNPFVLFNYERLRGIRRVGSARSSGAPSATMLRSSLGPIGASRRSQQEPGSDQDRRNNGPMT